jgi:hypothetical protein
MKKQGIKKKAHTAFKALFGSSTKGSKVVKPSVQDKSSEGTQSSALPSDLAPKHLNSLVREQSRSPLVPEVVHNGSEGTDNEIAGQLSSLSLLTDRACN